MRLGHLFLCCRKSAVDAGCGGRRREVVNLWRFWAAGVVKIARLFVILQSKNQSVINFTEFLSTDLPVETYISCGVALVCAILLSTLLLCRLGRVARQIRFDTSAELPETGYPALSVIVTAGDDAWNLPVLLPQILEQDYPAPLEVIMVEDGDSHATEAVVSKLQTIYPNLYMTFAPLRSRNLSRKKLSLTLGIKAARYDCLVFTCGTCRVASPLWLRSMARHFIEGRRCVIGYSAPRPVDSVDPADDKHRRTRSFDIIRTAVEYLSAAVGGKPYRGDGCNLAYTRDLFYSVKGFAGSLNYVNGDDDIFISNVANSDNCAVELSLDARVDTLQQRPAKAHRAERRQRIFTLRKLRSATPRLWAFMSLLWWLWLSASIAAVVSGLPSLLPLGAVTLISLGLCLPVMLKWRRLSAALGGRPLCLTVVWFMLVHPFTTLYARLTPGDIKHYTWQ